MTIDHRPSQQVEMDLTQLLVGMLQTPVHRDDLLVRGISMDSRKIKTGYLFLSLAKDLQTRNIHLEMALMSGATVILFEAQQPLSDKEVGLIDQYRVSGFAVRSLATKVGEIAARFYRHPSLSLQVIAVTGTNGKTSVTQFIAQALEACGQQCGVIGTLGVGRVNALQHTGMTTPDPVTLQSALAEMRDQAVKYVVIEASSHALVQGRLNSVSIDCAVYTNLSRDHLDYHANMVEYAAVKQSLFEVTELRNAVINAGDDLGKKILALLDSRSRVKTISYASIAVDNVTASHIQASQIELSVSGLSFSIESDFGDDNLSATLLGQFNVDNLLATLGVLLLLDISFEQAMAALSACKSVSGRMESYGNPQQPCVIVDYAHTPDALEKALQSLRSHLKTGGDLWCVFGCGGNRDVGKRSLMGRCAESLADKVILTDDNPRTEDNLQIINDILAGTSQSDKIITQSDRRLAITYAITHAKVDDIVLIAGKGHENYQDIANVRHLFSDAQVVCEVLAELINDTDGLVENNS